MNKKDAKIEIAKSKDIRSLEYLSNDKDYEVRAAVALNPNTPVNILKKLAEDNKLYKYSSSTEASLNS